MGLEINRVKYNDSWQLVRLKEVCNRISDGTHFTPTYVKNGVPFISVKDIYNDEVHFDKCKYIDKIEHQELIKRCNPEKDDVLITKSGTIGRMALVPATPQFSLFVSVALIKNKKDIIGSKFLKYCLENFLNSINIAQDIKGGLLKNFHLEDIRETIVPLVPVNEQEQILLKIEELLSEVDKGIEEIKIAQQQLKVYRQAVLKWAFAGKLTNNVVSEGELPKGWKRIKLEEACIIKRGKSKHRPRNAPLLYGGKYPFIQTGDIRNANGGYITTYNQTYSELGLQQSKLWSKGTLCITIAANIGETAILNFEACFPDSVVGLVCNEEILLTTYTNYFFISYKSKLEEIAPATAQKNINVEILERVEIPIGSIEEQQQIVQEIESRLSVCDKIEETITKSLKQAEALRQSILKKAFEGKLVKEEVPVYKPKSVYFYQTQTLGYISYYSSKHNIEHGEMTIAKYAYLLDKVYKIPTYYTYDRWHLGPYPPKMKKAIKNKKFFKQIDNKIDVANVEDLLKYNNPNKEKIASAINDLAEIFSGYSRKDRSHKTELLATVCKVVEDIQSVELSAVRQSMKEWSIELATTKLKNKAEKFTEEETADCLKFLMEKAWDKNLKR